MTRADVVIVGARCSGAAVAHLLARTGLTVAVVDRSPRGSDALSTHALMRGAVLQLSRWGLLDLIRAAGTPTIRRTTFVYGDDPVVVAIEPRDGIDGLYAPRRALLDSVLADAAAAAGADIRYRHRLTGLRRDTRGRVIGVEVVDDGDRRHDIQARWVIGADGLHSAVARMVDAPALHTWAHAAAVVYGHWPGIDADGYRWYFSPGCSAGAIPTNGGQTCVFVSMPPAIFRERCHGRLEAGYRAVLADVAPDLAAQLPDGPPPEGFRGFGGHAGYTRQSHGAGWALAGDAAAFRDPITAHGITDALRDAESLAAAIVNDTPDGWRDHDERRDALAAPIAEISDRLASFAWTLDEARDLHLQLSRAMGREARAIAAPR